MLYNMIQLIIFYRMELYRVRWNWISNRLIDDAKVVMMVMLPKAGTNGDGDCFSGFKFFFFFPPGFAVKRSGTENQI